MRVIILFSIIMLANYCFSQPLPTSFDLRNLNGQDYVTSVKYQQGGTCWAHGALAAIEGNLLMTGAWVVAGETGEPDLAEYHLDWWNGFNEHNNDDVVPPTGTGLTVHMGGDYRVTSAYLSRGEGAVRESDAPSYTTPSLRQSNSYHYFYPRRIEWYEVGQNLGNIETLKRKIMNYGVMGTCMLYSGSYINNQYVHYQPSSNNDDPNHAVAIVGWDDNKITQAPLPGAWLCKNSWGANWGLNGYFWISYYDRHCGHNPEMGAISFQNVEPLAYDHIYYHDYHGWRDTWNGLQEAMNAYTAVDDHLVNAISFFTATDSVDFTAVIFNTFTNSTLSDTLSIITGRCDHSGFHTIDLANPVHLQAGNDFYVYVHLSLGGHPYDRTSDVPVLLGGSQRTIVPSSASIGESWYRSGNSWEDLFYAPLPQYAGTANFCIKALCVLDPGTGTAQEDLGPVLLEPYPNPAKNKVSFRYRLQKAGNVSLTIYDLQGKNISQPLNENRPTGTSVFEWHIDQVNRIKPGLYIAVMESDGKRISRRLIIQ